MSAALSWMIVRDNSAYLLKKRGVKKPFSTEAQNLRGVNSFRYNGFVHKKTVGITAAPDNKGFTVTTKKAKAYNTPAKSHIKVTMKSGARRALYKLKKYIKSGHYRPELTKSALRKASAILRSQKKPKGPRKTRAKKQE